MQNATITINNKLKCKVYDAWVDIEKKSHGFTHKLYINASGDKILEIRDEVNTPKDDYVDGIIVKIDRDNYVGIFDNCEQCDMIIDGNLSQLKLDVTKVVEHEE